MKTILCLRRISEGHLCLSFLPRGFTHLLASPFEFSSLLFLFEQLIALYHTCYATTRFKPSLAPLKYAVRQHFCAFKNLFLCLTCSIQLKWVEFWSGTSDQVEKSKMAAKVSVLYLPFTIFGLKVASAKKGIASHLSIVGFTSLYC